MQTVATLPDCGVSLFVNWSIATSSSNLRAQVKAESMRGGPESPHLLCNSPFVDTEQDFQLSQLDPSTPSVNSLHFFPPPKEHLGQAGQELVFTEVSPSISHLEPHPFSLSVSVPCPTHFFSLQCLYSQEELLCYSVYIPETQEVLRLWTLWSDLNQGWTLCIR